MNNSLETFVKDNRKAFDVLEAPTGLWDKIEKELNTQKKKKKSSHVYLWMSSAAAVILVFGLLWVYNGTKSIKTLDIVDVDSTYAKKEVHYAGLITEKRDSLEFFAAANPELYKKFTSDLRKIDAEYERLKTELPISPNQLLVVKAMIKNREAQLQLLKQQLIIINQVDDYKKVNQI
ncbi:hypothetical protein [Pedobacter sp. MW01-1-1]|uniref:hypothetical protein n=1 Tax=Pedobacter sp. MW01-1-1 TaxID=3383027 RepID=UPI003FEEDE53